MLFRSKHIRSFLVLAASALVSADASALESRWADSGKAQARLIVAGDAKEGARLRAGIEIRLQRGWHTYWRYAGDAGLPPRFDWSGSENLEQVKILWPAPVRIAVEDDIESIGYKDAVLLPVHLFPENPAKPIVLKLKLDYGVCEKICIPATANIALTVSPGSGQTYPALDAAEARVPKKIPLGGTGKLRVIAAKLERGPKPMAVVDVMVPADKPFDLFAEGPSDDWALPLPKRKALNNGRARFVITLDDTPAGGSPIKSLRLTLVSGGDAIEVTAPLD
jgi:DsbC/DsbD-like thiol-disulfide interchange protein